MEEHKDNISKLKDCYGCGVCAIGCPVKIIDLKLNDDGFYSPVIQEQEKCIECGICLDICAYNHNEIAQNPVKENIKAFGAWSKDNVIRESSTTGGIGYELAHTRLKNGAKVCAVEYDFSKNIAQHYIASSDQELKGSQGTKYIPSFTLHGLKQLNRKDKFVVFGLPCQIDSLRRYIKKFKLDDNFILVDLFCYGVPSHLLWERTLDSFIKTTGKITEVKFRSKINGWHHSACLELEGDNGKIIRQASESPFFRLFFANTCLNKCCSFSCKYKCLNSSADIRIGDYWGKKYKTDEKGVNVVLSFTERGDNLISDLAKNCIFEESEIDQALEGQRFTNAPRSPLTSFVMWSLKNKIPLNLISTAVKYGRFIFSPSYLIKKLKR